MLREKGAVAKRVYASRNSTFGKFQSGSKFIQAFMVWKRRYSYLMHRLCKLNIIP
jgi:hypothetical protein